jgi:hypothetical protein
MSRQTCHFEQQRFTSVDQMLECHSVRAPVRRSIGLRGTSGTWMKAARRGPFSRRVASIARQLK